MPSTDVLARRLAGALRAAGASTLFGLPGGGPNLAVIGAAEAEGMRFVLAHGETAAAIMASTHALLTGTPTAVVATRPRHASLANGVAQATLDRCPLIAVTDAVPADQAHRVAHQRLDQRALFAAIAKASATIGAATTDEELARLIACAHTWPFGAVHLDYDPGSASTALPTVEDGPGRPADALEDARSRFAAARRPLVIVGAEAAALGQPLRAVLERSGWPVLTTYQAVGLIDSEGDLNAGLFTNGALEAPVLAEADLIVAIGLDEVEPIAAPWTAAAPLIRVSSVVRRDAYFDPAVDLVGDVVGLASQLIEPVAGRAERPVGGGPDPTANALRSEARAMIRACEPVGDRHGGVGPVELVLTAAALTPPGTTVTVDAGAHFLAIMPLWPARRPHELLISNGLATMGYAVPAAIGAALARPGRPALALTGDGGLSMVLGELETIARLALPVTVVVFNDAALSLIAIKQTGGDGGPGAVRYGTVDYAAIARANGLAGVVVDTRPQLREVMAHGWDAPRLIDVRLDPSSYPALIKATRG